MSNTSDAVKPLDLDPIETISIPQAEGLSLTEIERLLDNAGIPNVGEVMLALTKSKVSDHEFAPQGTDVESKPISDDIEVTEAEDKSEFKDTEEYSEDFLKRFKDYYLKDAELDDIKKMIHSAELSKEDSKYNLLIIVIGSKKITIKFTDKAGLANFACTLIKAYYDIYDVDHPFADGEGYDVQNVEKFMVFETQDDTDRYQKLLAIYEIAEKAFPENERFFSPIGNLTHPFADYWTDIINLPYTKKHAGEFLTQLSKAYAQLIQKFADPTFIPQGFEKNMIINLLTKVSGFKEDELTWIYDPSNVAASGRRAEISSIPLNYLKGLKIFTDELLASLQTGKLDYTKMLSGTEGNLSYRKPIKEIIMILVEHCLPNVFFTKDGFLFDKEEVLTGEDSSVNLAKQFLDSKKVAEAEGKYFETILKSSEGFKGKFINGNEYKNDEINKYLDNLSPYGCLLMRTSQIGPIKIGESNFIAFKNPSKEQESYIYFKLPQDGSAAQAKVEQIGSDFIRFAINRFRDNIKLISESKMDISQLPFQIHGILGFPVKLISGTTGKSIKDILSNTIEEGMRDRGSFIDNDLKAALKQLYSIVGDGTLADATKNSNDLLRNPTELAKFLREITMLFNSFNYLRIYSDWTIVSKANENLSNKVSQVTGIYNQGLDPLQRHREVISTL